MLFFIALMNRPSGWFAFSIRAWMLQDIFSTLTARLDPGVNGGSNPPLHGVALFSGMKNA